MDTYAFPNTICAYIAAACGAFHEEFSVPSSYEPTLGTQRDLIFRKVCSSSFDFTNLHQLS